MVLAEIYCLKTRFRTRLKAEKVWQKAQFYLKATGIDLFVEAIS